jgi:urea-proton symporter
VTLGKINIPNLALPYSAVCSGVTSLLFSGIITVGISLACEPHVFFYIHFICRSGIVFIADPANYDFKGTRAISVIDPVDPELSDKWKDISKQSSKEGASSNSETKSPASADEFQRTFRRAMWPSLILTLIVVVVSVFKSASINFRGVLIIEHSP